MSVVLRNLYYLIYNSMENIADDNLEKLCETANLFSAQNHEEERAWEDLFEKVHQFSRTITLFLDRER